MKIYLLKELQSLQQHLAGQYQFHQVIGDTNEQYHWQCIDTAPFPELVNKKPQSSVKSFFFSERENILTFNGEYFQETLPTPKPFVLFGVQSCDLVAVQYQDQFFKDDPYYQARRQQCLLVGIDCLTPCQNGFCPTLDAGPGVKESSADLILHPLEDGHWLLIQSSEKGEKALEGMVIAGEPLSPTHWHYLTQRDLNLQHCVEQFPDDSHILAGIEKINRNEVSEHFWQQAAIQCIGCSGCTSLCPTCSCYGTRSIEQDEHIVQQRFWDSCLYEGFQKEASFHNPTVEAGKRVERFWRHKFREEYRQTFDRYGCVGCGRCEQTCPGVIGVHSIMKRIVNNA